MELIYIVIIIVIVIPIFVSLSKEKKKNRILRQQIEQTQKETSATIATQQENFIKEKSSMYSKGEFDVTIKRLVDNQTLEIENITAKYKETISKLQSYVQSVEKQSRNFGEINTHKILTDLKNELVSKGIIKSFEMIIMPNVFIPLENNSGVVTTRQIDHLILTTKGIFIIETKFWKGTILYGLSKEKAKDFSFILDGLYPNIKISDEKTIVFNKSRDNDNDEQNKKELKVVSYEDPANQVRTTALHLNKLLKKYDENIFITPIIYFGYNEKHFINYSRNSNPIVFDNKELLYNFFFTKFSECNIKNFNSQQLDKIESIIKNLNYI